MAEKGKHRAEDRDDKKSTSESVEGKRNDASKGKHRAPKIPDGVEGHKLGRRGAPPKYTEGDK